MESVSFAQDSNFFGSHFIESYVAPDSYRVRLVPFKIGSRHDHDGFELIAIGSNAWVRFGGEGWVDHRNTDYFAHVMPEMVERFRRLSQPPQTIGRIVCAGVGVIRWHLVREYVFQAIDDAFVDRKMRNVPGNSVQRISTWRFYADAITGRPIRAERSDPDDYQDRKVTVDWPASTVIEPPAID